MSTSSSEPQINRPIDYHSIMQKYFVKPSRELVQLSVIKERKLERKLWVTSGVKDNAIITLIMVIIIMLLIIIIAK